jgi:hypothetical protein
MRGVTAPQRSFNPATTARFLLLAAAWLAGLGLANLYLLTASSLENILLFGGAGLALIAAAELKWIWPRLTERFPNGNAKPEA